MEVCSLRSGGSHLSACQRGWDMRVCEYDGICWWPWYKCRTFVSIIVIVIDIIIIIQEGLRGLSMFIGMIYNICVGWSRSQTLVLRLGGFVG